MSREQSSSLLDVLMVYQIILYVYELFGEEYVIRDGGKWVGGGCFTIKHLYVNYKVLVIVIRILDS